MSLPVPKQWEPLAAVPIVAGLWWLFAAAGGGWLFWALIPGVLMLAAGVGLLLWPGDLRLTEFMALGALLALIVAVPVTLFGAFVEGLICALLAAGAFLVSGRVALAQEQAVSGVPPPDATIAVAAKAALDEALLAYFVGTADLPSGERAQRVCARAPLMEKAMQDAGFAEQPELLHKTPPAPERVYAQQARLYGYAYERLSWDSGFVADARIPGADAWMEHRDNRQVTAWMLRHPGPPRPWLVCVHGYRMGHAWMDLGLFPPRWLHEQLGVNLLMPTLPLHGSRRMGWRSGDGFLDGDPFDLIFAETQAVWDLRRAIAYLRAQEESPRIGVLGYSLGGYNTAMLAQYETGLDFAIAGIPAVDLAGALWRHLQPWHRGYYAAQGLTLERYRNILRSVSPVARPPKLPRERLYLFAGVADRVVLPEQVAALSKHWDVPVQWYQGAHLTFRHEPLVRQHIEAAMQRAGWPVSAELILAR
ncbi:MAG TPA: prolyl oligopeptidase family serine peptidase [Candidatus Binatia bacterium]|nr:prolyl oligopeptidase family serine peptidase [Candidatus Binatia bacterium]